MSWFKKLFGGGDARPEAPPAAPPQVDDKAAVMAQVLASLGIPLDMGMSAPEAAFIGGVVKASIFHAVQLLQSRQLDEARNALDSALHMLEGKTVDPKVRGVCHFLRARARVQLGDRDGAGADLQEARQLYPGHPMIEGAYAAFTGADDGRPPFYAPALEGAVEVKRIAVTDALEGVLRRHPAPEQQAGSVKYLYTLAVHPKGGGDAEVYVASEINKMPPGQRSGSHFLGVFPGEGHVNLGAADDWADIDKFEARALEVVREGLARG
jgi:hypothetical protein